MHPSILIDYGQLSKFANFSCVEHLHISCCWMFISYAKVEFLSQTIIYYHKWMIQYMSITLLRVHLSCFMEIDTLQKGEMSSLCGCGFTHFQFNLFEKVASLQLGQFTDSTLTPFTDWGHHERLLKDGERN